MGKVPLMEQEHFWHLAKATLLAAAATLLLAFQQVRHAFHERREAFVAFQRKKHEIQKKGKQTKIVDKIGTNPDEGTFVVAFFHPRCTDGGGGERVLWKAIQALGELKEDKPLTRRTKTSAEVKNDPSRNVARNVAVVVYTIDEPSANYERGVLEKVRDRFGITLPASLSVHFVHLHEVKDLLGKCVHLFMGFVLLRLLAN